MAWLKFFQKGNKDIKDKVICFSISKKYEINDEIIFKERNFKITRISRINHLFIGNTNIPIYSICGYELKEDK